MTERSRYCLLKRNGDGKIKASLLVSHKKGKDKVSYRNFIGDSLSEIIYKIRLAKFRGPLTLLKLPSYVNSQH